MAIAAALNILVTSPSEQLRNDLRKQGISVSQFAKSINDSLGKATNKATNELERMAKALDLGLRERLIDVEQYAKGLQQIGHAYTYVNNGGDSFRAMLADAERITKKHADGTGGLLDRYRQLGAMYAANKITAAAYHGELVAMTGTMAKLKATANFGADISAIRRRSITPQQELSRGRRAADRAFGVGAIDALAHAREMARLQSRFDDQTGVTAAKKRQAAEQETMRAVARQLLDMVRIAEEEAKASLAAQKRAAIENENQRLMSRTATLNAAALTDFERMAQQMEELNRLRRDFALTPAAFQMERGRITGTTATDAARQQALDAARAREQARMNSLVDEANALNTRYASRTETLRQAHLRLNAVRATGVLTQRAYTAAMAEATAAATVQNNVLARLGFTMHNMRSALGLFNPWLVAVGALAAGARVFADFEQSMQRVAAYSLATNQEMRQLTATASELGKTTLFAARDVADAMTELAKAGFRADDIVDAIRPTLRLATIGMMDLKAATEITARVMAGMQIPASRLADVVDALAVAETGSVTSVEELGEALKFVGPVAQQAGLSLDDVMASLMVLGNAGLAGEIAGTGLRNVVLRLVKPTEEAAAAFQRLADSIGQSEFHLKTAEGRMMPMLEIIKQFEAATKDMGEMEKLKVMNEIFRTRSTTVFAALSGGGSAQFEKMLALQENRQGVAAAQEAIVSDTMWGDLKMFGSALAGLATDAEGLGGILRFVINVATALIRLLQAFFAEIMAGVHGLIANIASFFGAIMEWIPGLRTAGKWLNDFAKAEWENRNDNVKAASAGWEGAKTSTARAFDMDNTEQLRAELRAKLDVTDAEIEQIAAKMKADQERTAVLMKTLDLQKEMVKAIDEQIASVNEATQVSIYGADAAKRMAIYHDQMVKIGEVYAKQQKAGLEDAHKNYVESRQLLDLKLQELEAAQKQAELAKQRDKLVQGLKQAQEAVATHGMTEGDKLLHGLGGNVTPSDERAAAAMDAAIAKSKELAEIDKQRTELTNGAKDAMKEFLQLRMTEGQKLLDDLGANATAGDAFIARDLDNLKSLAAIGKTRLEQEQAFLNLESERTALNAGDPLSKFDQIYNAAFDTAMLDGILTNTEEFELELLRIQLDRNEAIDKEIAKRKEVNAELVKNFQDLSKTGEDLMKKHNPLKSYQEEFVKLKTMLQVGLIDQATFDKERMALRNETLKSAGPANIGFSKAIERGTAEDYSASLKQFKNPEYEELMKQTRQAEKSQKTLNEIRDGVKEFNEGKQLDAIAP